MLSDALEFVNLVAAVLAVVVLRWAARAPAPSDPPPRGVERLLGGGAEVADCPSYFPRNKSP